MLSCDTESARASLSAGPLPSYAFRIEAVLGDRPMTYLFARRAGDCGRVLSRLVVLTPQNLRSTWVDIVEQHGDHRPHVTVSLPTMRTPRVVSGRHLFSCLPLTDVGYLDLMAWMHPLSVPVTAADPGAGRTAAAGLGPSDERRSVDGESGYEVVEHVLRQEGVTVARRVLRDGTETRSWEVLELGAGIHDHLPRSIRATRSETGQFTEFSRTTDPRPIPPEWFEDDIQHFMNAVDAEVSG